MSPEVCAEKMLEVVFRTKPHNHDGCNEFEMYCHSVARRYPTVWSSFLIRDAVLWTRYHDFFDKYKCSWQHLCHEKGYRYGLSFEYHATNDPTSMQCQYLMAIIDFKCINMIKKLLDELPLETILSVPLPGTPDGAIDFGWPTDDTDYVTILDTLAFNYFHPHTMGAYNILLESLNSRMKPSKLFWFCLGAHYHEFICESGEDCIIVDLLEAGANANFKDSLLTPLQLSVRNWDYAGVKVLLEHGADPNVVGQPGGYIPTHLDTTWAQSSPLHILRNADYGFTALEPFVELEVRAEHKPFLIHYTSK